MSATPRIAVVTGAGSGIGRSATLALLREGFSVVLAGRREERLKETVELAGVEPERTLVVPANVADPASVRILFERTVERFGRVDVLFNNAGTGAPPAAIDELSLEHWKRVVDVNLTGAFLCIQQAFRIMKTQRPMGGRIINNGSISAYAPRPGSAPYTATKHAISGLTKTVSLDGRPYDIACGQLDIGNAATELTAYMKNGGPVPQASGALAVEPTMDVDHVGRAVALMACLPLDANVQSMTLMATKMPFVGRG